MARKSNEINISFFSVFHEKLNNELENLRPICSTCNKSMATDDLNDFKTTYNLGDVLNN